MNIPEELKRRYREGRVVPFLGAGVSMSVEWTSDGQNRQGLSWAALVDRAAELEGFDEPGLLRVRGTDLQILEYFRALNDGSFARLTNWFNNYMNPRDEDLQASPVLSALAELTKCSVMYTTNFDDFIERSLRLAGRSARAISVELDIAKRLKESPLEQVVEVVKFHGDLDHPNRMVLSEKDYDDRMTFAEPMDQRLKTDVLGRAVLFLGYSFRDYNVSYLFRVLQSTYGDRLPEDKDGTRAYIALFDPSDFEETLFRRRGIKVISLQGRLGHSQQTAALLRELTT